MATYTIEESPFAHFLFSDTRAAWLWLFVRLYLGWEWLQAGWGKVNNPAWAGSDAGAALTGFVNNALTKTEGAHPDVQWWYAWFLQHAVLPHVTLWSNMVAWGELLVGIALIVGLFVGLAAFAGMFMNFNFMLAGSVSVNPIWFAIAIGLVLSWRVAGYMGLDRYVLPRLHRFFRPRVSR
ncbi:MAG: TQO small subunit DoxD [bacterium]|nr:TQO small subunit DoxD [bacterium]